MIYAICVTIVLLALIGSRTYLLDRERSRQHALATSTISGDEVANLAVNFRQLNNSIDKLNNVRRLPVHK